MKVNKFIILNHFVVSRYTMAILPYLLNNDLYAKVVEEDGEYIVKQTPLDIIRHSCDYYGCSFQGRKEGTKAVIGITHKAPIAIEPSNEIYFFPTASPKDSCCVWLSHMHVYRYEPAKYERTVVYFRNGKSVVLDVSCKSFINQLHRTAQLRTKLSERMEARERKLQYIYRMQQEKNVTE